MQLCLFFCKHPLKYCPFNNIGMFAICVRKKQIILKLIFLVLLVHNLTHCRLRRNKQRLRKNYPYFSQSVEKKHPFMGSLLNNVEVCGICEYNHSTNNCHSFPELKAMYHGTNGDIEYIFFIAQNYHGNHDADKNVSLI